MKKYNSNMIKLISILRSDPDYKLFLNEGVIIHDIRYKYPAEDHKKRSPIKGDNFEVSGGYITPCNVNNITIDRINVTMYNVGGSREPVIGYIPLEDIDIIFREGYVNIKPVEDNSFSIKVDYDNEKQLIDMASVILDWFCDVYPDMVKNEYGEHLSRYFIHMMAICKTNMTDYTKVIEKYPKEFGIHINYSFIDWNKDSFLISIELDNGLNKDFYFINEEE